MILFGQHQIIKQLHHILDIEKRLHHGASSYHGGIDIGAMQGSPILAIADGTVSLANWNGGNGYCVIVKHDNDIISTYGHVNPNFVVKKGDFVHKGDVIAHVGPKYVEEKSYTTYKDSTRKMYKWRNNWTSSTFCYNKKWKKVKSAFSLRVNNLI